MTKKLQHLFALSEKGAKDLVKAVFWCFVCNLSLMLPVGAVLFTAQHLLDSMENGGNPVEGFWICTGFAAAVLLLLFVLHWFQYASLYLATYKESANRRVSLAETLRRLPLSFFGNRDLSDLTSTMIADCSSLDQMFSHYVPQLFASVFSTLVIGIAMFLCDWRMALAILWVVPVAVLLTAGSKRIQDSFGTKNILNKRAVADCIQEGLETIRDIKACSRQEAYMGKLKEKLAAMEKGSIHSELATGVFVCSAQAFLRLGLATTILTGGALLAGGELSFLYFLGFLFAAARLYDPLGLVLQNIAATFNTKLQIERMRSILEQPVQKGVDKESANRRVSLAETLRRLPLSFFGNRDLSDLTSTMIADCSSLDQMFSHYVPQLFASVFSTLVIGIAMFLCDWRMALAILWVVPVAVLLTAGSKRIQDSFGTKNILNKRAVADCIQEGLETIRDIKACSRQEAYMGKLKEKLAAMEKGSIHSELATGVFVCSAQAFLRLGLATTILTGGALLAGGELSFLYFLGFLFAAARLYDPLGLVLQNIAATFNTKLQIERMRSILEQPVQKGVEEFTPANYDITFEHVSFAYREGDGVLEDVSFTARQGEVTALIGPSGGGKSTACKLAARFWDASRGKVTLGGVDVSGVDPETLLKHYSMVFQDVVLFRDTVMENIRLGRRGATDEEVIAAAKAARCDEFIRKLPQGYQTMIGENGSTLSGGERQRISIARALLKDAPVILLDEATASLDVENESAVQDALSRLLQGRTVLVIAHRMRTVAGADHIVVLENGRVAQQGTPEELMEQGGLYRRMVELQRETARWKLEV